jgi:hypothetical protein
LKFIMTSFIWANDEWILTSMNYVVVNDVSQQVV